MNNWKYDDKKIILEGIFTEFSNVNTGRIYTVDYCTDKEPYIENIPNENIIDDLLCEIDTIK